MKIPNIKTKKVVVVDYGAGNLLSVVRAFEYCGYSVDVSDKSDKIINAARVVLPGVGSFPKAMNSIEERGLIDVLHSAKQRQVPLMGICLGMQLLFDYSEEFGRNNGIGLLQGHVEKINCVPNSGERLKIPHIGWQPLQICENGGTTALSAYIERFHSGYFYFVHSYCAIPTKSLTRLAKVCYAGQEICAIAGEGQILGCQFHPEKSGAQGLKLIQEFAVI